MFDSLGHINVVVPDIEEATAFYAKFFGAAVEQSFPHFRNEGFSRSAGLLDETVEVSIRFFYALDPYGIQWEFEEGHADIGTE